MKIRMGFVSNSSSSSFCIYGIFIEKDVFLKIIKKESDDDDYEDWYEDGWYEDCEKMASELGLEFHPIDGNEGLYFGCSWRYIGDKETGGEFKKTVDEKIAKLLGKEGDCKTYEEAYYC
jgi:hypothetical protein